VPLELAVDVELVELVDVKAEALELEVATAPMTMVVTKGLMSFEVAELARTFRR